MAGIDWLSCKLYLRELSPDGLNQVSKQSIYEGWHAACAVHQFEMIDEYDVSSERIGEFFSYFGPRESFVLALSRDGRAFRFDHYVFEENVRVLICGIDEPCVWREVEGEPEAWEEDGLFHDLAALTRELASGDLLPSDRQLLQQVIATRQPCLGTEWPLINAYRAATAASRQYNLPRHWSAGAC